MSKISSFKLSTKKKKKILQAEDKDDGQESQREAIKSIQGNVLESAESKGEKKELVIPLPEPKNPEGLFVTVKQSKGNLLSDSKTVKNKSSSKEESTSEEKELSVEELAAQEILNELNKGQEKNKSELLVINSTGNKQQGNDDIDNTEAEGSGMVRKKAPLLMANVAPELLSINDEDERFKKDVELKADNVDVTSDAYLNVPIAEFGAAMLRGMGWSGPKEGDDDKDKYAVTPRDYRLGLGATPRPPDEKTRGKSKKDKEKEKNKWEKKAEEALLKQQLQVGSLVWLREKSFVGQRAEVVATTGVPGLNKIQVQLEKSGEYVNISKLDAVILTEDELKETPFRRNVKRQTDREEDRKDKKRRKQDNGMERQGGEGDREDRSKKKKEYKAQDVNFSTEKKNPCNNDSGADFSPLGWLRTGIRVKVVSRKVGGDKYYLQKGNVDDVFFASSTSNTKMASVRMDIDKKCIEAKEKYLETVIPDVGGNCLVLVGEHAGETATLLEKNSKRGSVSVQLLDEMDVITVSMDDVSACTK